jgi:hypothetical protein
MRPSLIGMKTIVREIDTNFCSTSYKRGLLWYPAPFGDLRDSPLDYALQQDAERDSICTEGCVEKRSSTSYTIKGWPIGLNPHIPICTHDINIVNGIPEGFIFYTGYNKKYSSVIDEWADILSPRRVFSLFKK